MIGFAMYHDDMYGQLVVQLQDEGKYVGEISISERYAEDYIYGVQMVIAYIEALNEMKEFVKEVIIDELPETEQEQQGNHTRHAKLQQNC